MTTAGSGGSAGTVLKTGWVVVADIVGYSRKSDERQRDLATFLIGSVETSYLHRAVLRGSTGFSLACTGDGFILVVADEALGPRGGESVLRFVDEMMRTVAAYADIVSALPAPHPPYDSEFLVRMAIHRGDFSFETIVGQRNAIGTGVNMACRIAGIGDAGHVLVSDEAAVHLYDAGQIPPGAQLVPLGEAGVKHDVGVFVYSYVRRYASGTNLTIGRDQNPKLLERSVRVDELIRAELKRHRLTLSRWLGGQSVSAAGARLTILAPSVDGKRLCVTEYRDVDGEPGVPSRAAYRLGTTAGTSEGVSALAFTSSGAAWIVGLPERYEKFQEYCGALNRVGLNEHLVATFGRPCRSFIAVYFRLPVANDGHYVLAFDSLSPLYDTLVSSLDDAVTPVPWIEGFVQQMNDSAVQIARLLELRYPRPRGTVPVTHARTQLARTKEE